MPFANTTADSLLLRFWLWDTGGERNALKLFSQCVSLLYGKQNKVEKRKYLCSSECFLSLIYEKHKSPSRSPLKIRGFEFPTNA